MIRRWLADRLFRVVFRLAECRHDTPRPDWDLAQGKLRDQATEEYWTAYRARQDAQTRAEILDELRQRSGTPAREFRRLLFDTGQGYLPTGTSVVQNNTGRPEPLTTYLDGDQ